MRAASIAVAAEPPPGRFSAAVEAIVRAIDAGGVSSTIASALIDLTGLDAAAVYVPGRERDRWEREAVAGNPDLLPASVRTDHGPVARLLAAGRIAASPEEVGASADGDSSRGGLPPTLWSIPLRDALERPLGTCLVGASDAVALDPELEYRMFRLRPVIEGALVAVEARREQESALSILPELVDVAHALDEPIAQQLEELARIVARATRSDAALVRVRDAAARYVETRAAWSRSADGAGEVVGLRSSLHEALPASELGEVEGELLVPEDVEEWSGAASRTLEALKARRIAIFPIESAYNRQASLWLVRAADRPFGDIDRAVARIVTSHLQHTIDRHVGRLQTARATTAAHSAIRLLGRALVAGVRPEQTLRFVPRLYHEMFGATGARLWRETEDGGLTRIAGSGSMSGTTASPVVLQALAQPLELALSTDRRPHVAAVGLGNEGATRIVVEFELRPERTLGRQEQTLAVDVAERVAQSLESAERAASRARQLERIGGIQDVLARANESFASGSIEHVIVEGMRDAFSASAAVLLVADSGPARTWNTESVPTTVADALVRERHVVPAAAGSEQDAPVFARALGSDERFGELGPAFVAAGWSDAAAVTVPLTSGDHTVGGLLLVFADGQPGLGAGDLPLLEIVGGHLGRALLNARESRRLTDEVARLESGLARERESTRQVRALYEVSRTFATSMSLQETMTAVVQAMADRLDVDAVWMAMPEEGSGLKVRAFHSVHHELGDALERMVTGGDQRDDPLAAHVLQHRQAVLLRGSDELAQWPGSGILSRLMPFFERGSTVAVIPVATPNEVLGTVTLITIDPANELTQEKVDIATGVASQAALALDNARLYQQQKHFAEVIQESLLPTRLPRVQGLELGVLYRSASGGGAEVGGDFYDFLELDDGRLAVVLGDVCGKGVGAAADTAMTKYTFRALAREHPSPAAFLSYANDVIAEEIALGKFVTLFYAVVDPTNGTITCGNAGHPEPKLLNSSGPGEEPELESVSLEGIALGIMPEQSYEERTLPFPPGSSLVVYTDGVVEARRDGRLYGQYRLERRLLDERDAGAPQLAFAVYQDCAAYAEGGLSDDVAIVVVQHVHDSSMSPPEQA